MDEKSPVLICKVLWAYEAQRQDELSIFADENLIILPGGTDDWAFAKPLVRVAEAGYVPRNYIDIHEPVVELIKKTKKKESFRARASSGLKKINRRISEDVSSLRKKDRDKKSSVREQNKQEEEMEGSSDMFLGGELVLGAVFDDEFEGEKATPSNNQDLNIVSSHKPLKEKDVGSEDSWFQSSTDIPASLEMVKNLSSQGIQYQKAAYELYFTERNYVSDLEVLVDVYMKQMDSKKILTFEKSNILFSNCEQLLRTNQQLLSGLSALRTPLSFCIPNVGKLMMNFSQNFESYEKYVVNHPHSMLLFNKKKNKEPFLSFLRECNLTGRNRGLGLDSFLLKPVQRIMKYSLILREMARNCDQQPEEQSNLFQAIELMETGLDLINEKSKIQQNLAKINEIVSKIWSERPLLISSGLRNLIYEGIVGETSLSGGGRTRGDARLFLFDDILLITRVGKLKTLQKLRFFSSSSFCLR
eukprot:Lithocolla_globosa_v1_NODE_1317_length_2675_cov_12.388168.p1 type:complete len:473 gc:universal NODE_1317_length_2675_cov_12.388168:251-1669(+)